MRYKQSRITNLHHDLEGFTSLGRLRYSYRVHARIVAVAIIADPMRDVQPLTVDVWAGPSGARLVRQEFRDWEPMGVVVVPFLPLVDVAPRANIIVTWKGRASEVRLFHFEKNPPQTGEQLNFGDN